MVLRVGGRLKQLFAAYVEAKQLHNVLDYDDLLYWARSRPKPAPLIISNPHFFNHVL